MKSGTKAIVALGLAALAGLAGLAVYVQLGRRGGDVPAVAPPPAAAWASRPHVDWPQLVLTNDATFSGHTALQGASAFLLQAPSGATLAATAKHLIREAAGVEPPLSAASLDGALRRRVLHPRTRPDASVR